MEMRGFMGGFYRISEWIMRLAVINVLWIVCSIPFFFFLLSTLLVPDPTMDQFLVTLWIMAIVSPFTVIPATTAMYSVVRKWVMGDEDVPLLRTYFRSYKENYKQSFIGGFIFVIIGVVIAINLQFYSNMEGALGWLAMLFLSFSVVFAVAFINFMSLMVHFNMKLLQLIKNAFIMTLGQPLTSFMILLANGFVGWISLTKFTFLIPFFMGTVSSYVSFWFFYRSFQRMQDKLERKREKEAEELELLKKEEE